MDLLEYQVKEWFREISIPVMPSQRIDHPTDLKRLKISYPIILKSQVHRGERAKAGGVRIAETTIDAIAAAQTIFKLPIEGELPEVLLAEAKYETEQEFYLAVILDTGVCRPVLLGSKEANVNWESPGEKMQYIVVDQEFSPFYARRLALKMGLQGSLMQSLSNIVEKMYRLFVQKDLDLVEINPLAVNANNQVMALNGNVKLNQQAIGRHSDIASIAKNIVPHHYTNSEKNGNLGDWNGIELPGQIGIIGNGAGLVMATLDLVSSAGGKPGLCMNLGHASLADTSLTTFRGRLEKALTILAADKNIQVILINLLGSIPQATDVAAFIANYVQKENGKLKPQMLLSNGNKSFIEGHFPPLVIRLAGCELNEARRYLATLTNQRNTPIVVVENLDEAVAEAVYIANFSTYKNS